MSDELPDRKHLTRIPVWIPDDQTVVYFVTTNCHNRRLIFRTPNTIKIALESLIKCAHSTEWNIPQICFMPDHVHLMMLPMREREQQLSSMMQRWKSSSKQRLNRAGESLTEKWRYVEMNPVRAGLCTLPEEFPYLGSPEQILARLNSL